MHVFVTCSPPFALSLVTVDTIKKTQARIDMVGTHSMGFG